MLFGFKILFNNLRVLGERKPNDLKHDSQNPSTVEFIYNRLVTKSGLERSKDKSPVPSLFKQCICEGLLRFFYFEIRLITKRILNPNNILPTCFIIKSHCIIIFSPNSQIKKDVQSFVIIL
jgi:hypothetical protein